MTKEARELKEALKKSAIKIQAIESAILSNDPPESQQPPP